jgi:catechol 2,3-dioxygenase-like lactoylglutathione lyase family enzyme
MAGPVDASLRKFHASLNVSDLDRSVAFYRVLLGKEPAKVRADYAKFELAEPPLVLSLIPGHGDAGGSGNLNHAGLRVRTAEELVEIQHRLEAAGFPTQREDGVECCYARQTKFWISDPDRALWEIYVFHEDTAAWGATRPPGANADDDADDDDHHDHPHPHAQAQAQAQANSAAASLNASGGAGSSAVASDGAVSTATAAAATATIAAEGGEAAPCCAGTSDAVAAPLQVVSPLSIMKSSRASASAPVSGAPTTAPQALPPTAWSHRLSMPIPSRIPHDDNSLRGIQLEGSINTLPDAPNRASLVADAFRVLRPGGEVHVHGLAGDRTCQRSGADLKLPGPAAAVQFVPASGDVVQELVKAGFVDVYVEKLSSTAYFVVDEIPMRELRITARKPGHRPSKTTHQAIYLGPLAQVTDDFGNTFRRGEPTPLNVHDWQTLSKSSARSAFLLLAPEPGTNGATRSSACAPEPASEPAAAAPAAAPR